MLTSHEDVGDAIESSGLTVRYEKADPALLRHGRRVATVVSTNTVKALDTVRRGGRGAEPEVVILAPLPTADDAEK